MTSRPDPQDFGMPTLHDALTVADGMLSPLTADSTAHSRTYTGVMFYDPATPVTDYRDRIVLASGVSPADAAALAVAVDEVGVAAIVVRRNANDDGVPSIRDAGLRTPVLGHHDADWAQLAAVLRSLLSAHSVGHMTGVRLGDVFGLANALATLAEGAVSVVDASGQVVGYSTHSDQPIDDIRRRSTLMLQEEVPVSHDPDYHALLRAPTSRHFPSDTDQFGRVGVAVRAAGELLGSIWVIQVDPELAPRTQKLLEEAEPIAAQHLLRARENAAERDHRNSALLRTLLEDERHARSAAAQLLIRPEAGCTLVCFRVDTFDDVEAVRGIHRLQHLAISVSSAAFPGSHTAVIGSQAVTLVPGSPTARIRTFAQSVIRTDTSLIAGIGSRAHDMAGIARSYREASAAVSMLLGAPHGLERPRPARIATFDEMRDRLAVLQVTDLIDGLDSTVGDAASIITEHDAAQGTDLIRTVRTYLDLLGSVRETAMALHVHQNTVRYRLDVIRTELGVDLDSPDTRLWLWLRLSAAPR